MIAQTLKKIDQGLAFLRACVLCGKINFHDANKILVSKPAQICDYCYAHLERKILKSPVKGYDYPVRSLWSWDKGNELAIRKLILGLKGGGPSMLYRYFAELLCYRAVMDLKCNSTWLSDKWIVVPAPADQPTHLDHAGKLAKAIAEITGIKIRNCLRRTNSQKRKFLNFKMRREFGLEAIECNQNMRDARVIFVDDVITTGATATAAYMALAKPKDFVVWTIAHRPRL